ncbi:ATP-binding cassette domain-containing protein [Sphingomonas sp.]|uniref:ATP-binding cassette domain-containing protein n=1 Tax=Sphingomonas sp. TaxID=28214 RepID=UPI003B3ACB75
MSRAIDRLLRDERRRARPLLLRAGLLAGLVGAASVVLLGVSGWFITAAALAGMAGSAVAMGFNYMLPSAMIRLLAIVRTGARYGERLTSHAAAFGALARIRPALFRAICAAPVARSLALGTGEATARMIQDVDAIENRFVRLSAPASVAAAALSGIALTAIAGIAAAGATALLLVAFLLFGRLLARRLDAPGRAVQRAAGVMRQDIAELLVAAPELRCLGLEDWASARIVASADGLAAQQQRQAQARAWVELLHAATLAGAACLSALLAAEAGPALAALVALAAAMTIDGAVPLLRTFVEQGAVEEAEARLETWLAEDEAAVPADPLCLTLRFAQDGAMAHPPGSRLLLAGASGSGKTTLIEGLLGLRALPADRAWLGRHDVAHADPARLRRCFGWAPQDAMLIAGTVRDNLLLADPGASEEALRQAVHDAAADDLVAALPDGLDTWIGEDGGCLSGGERRRIALARAYLAPAAWLLLDEPSEGLDTATEALVIARLRDRLARTGQGLLLTSHRPATQALCALRVDVTAPLLRAAA